MATARHGSSDRASSSGKDIFSRMLQLEKLSKQRRQSSVGPPVRNLPVLQPAPARHSLLPSSTPLKRSQTAPVLSVNIPITEQGGKNRGEDKSSAVDDPESPTTEICYSPSWSDHGREKRRKEKKKKWEMEEKERKEAGSREKKEDNRLKAAALKAGKRLSKKPPAAMETQRMPAALRTQSMISPAVSQSTSYEDSRRPSTESRRSSVTSIASIIGLSKPLSRRSVSLESPSLGNYEPIVSTTAPQLGRLSGIEFVSRDGSLSTQDSGLFSGGKLFVEEILKSKKLDPPMDIQLETISRPLKEARTRTLSQPFQDTPPLSRSAMEAGSSNSKQDTSAEPKPLRSILARRGSSENGTLEKRDGTPKGYRYQTYDSPSDEIIKSEATKTAVAFDLTKHSRIMERKSSELQTSSSPQSTTLPIPPLTVSNDDLPSHSARPSHDGSSYVHKQRMYQQQRSIAGYEDELSLLPREQTWPPTPRDSNESIRKSQRMGTPGKRRSVDGDDLVKDRSTWYHEGLVDGKVLDGKKATMESNNESTVVNVLGPSEDLRPAGVSSSAHGSHHPNITTPTKSSPLSPLRQGTAQPPAGEIPQKPNQRENSLEVVKVESTKPADSSKDDKRSSSKLDHSRTRTNSSQLLAADLQPRTLLPPSPTTPKLPAVENRSPKAATLPPASKDLPNCTKDSKHSRKSEPIVTVAAKPNHTQNVKAIPEVIIGGIDGDGLIRQTSLKRPRSDPQLQVFTIPTKPPSLDFLPELKHQPLTKPKRNSPIRVSFAGKSAEPISPPSPSQFPVPLSAIQSTNKAPFSPSHPRRPSSNRPSSSGASNFNDPLTANALTPKPLAKMFVICCKCKYWHDLPSKLYEAMALPRKIEAGDKVAQSVGAVTGGEGSRKIGKGMAKGKEKGKDKAVVSGGAVGVEGKVFTTVKCPWCEHGMSTACCAGWTAVVYLHERHH